MTPARSLINTLSKDNKFWVFLCDQRDQSIFNILQHNWLLIHPVAKHKFYWPQQLKVSGLYYIPNPRPKTISVLTSLCPGTHINLRIIHTFGHLSDPLWHLLGAFLTAYGKTTNFWHFLCDLRVQSIFNILQVSIAAQLTAISPSIQS